MTRTTLGLAPPSPNFASGRALGHCVWLGVQKAPYTADLQWNRVSNLEPSCPKAETLPLGHRGLLVERESLRSERDE
ncbi:hypothetical protein AVEN_101189-1 [Araneus ventricosus]|uniref:Uncharacterized protein n=1 Tax=Araneus ventricosus TaxID=182803 RepID=A0A4Y2W9C7_ARAVE|nr:hypothetical protein AVEN_101189-1 [Araneus ventricosus]